MRTDLLALTTDSLAALTNRGLVKRAAKEATPELRLDADGTVHGGFPGGPDTSLPPGGLDAARCTCGAIGVCRHVIAVILTYQTLPITPASPAPGSAALDSPAPASPELGAVALDSPAPATPELGAVALDSPAPASPELGSTASASAAPTSLELGSATPGSAAPGSAAPGCLATHPSGTSAASGTPDAPGVPATHETLATHGTFVTPAAAGTLRTLGTSGTPGTTAETLATPGEEPRSWSPGQVTDDELTARLGARLMNTARRAERAGYTARIRRATPADPVPQVELPTATVRFLVPGDLGFVHTDAVAGSRDDVIALAVWAFRVADELHPGVPDVRVDVGGQAVTASGSGAAAGLERALALAGTVLREGAAHLGQGLEAIVADVTRHLDAAGLRWPLLAVGHLAEQLAAYRDRAAHYRPELLAGHL
ncbi:hypothetical protein ABT361_48100, partial [Nonomuraea wenchangensis]